jgi:glycerate kinase
MESVERVVIAPDSFKGTASATGVARALAAGWAGVRPADELVLMPMADGGEGTLDAFELAVAGARRMPVTVVGPDDRPVLTSWLLLPDGTGVVELASTSGITLLDPLRPLDAHTAGFGQAIAAALGHGVTRLYLALGGSASTDGGTGALAALGAVFTDAGGTPLPAGGRGLADLRAADLGGLPALPAEGALILSDVTNPLLGPNTAAAPLGPSAGRAVPRRCSARRRARIRPRSPGSTPVWRAWPGCFRQIRLPPGPGPPAAPRTGCWPGEPGSVRDPRPSARRWGCRRPSPAHPS